MHILNNEEKINIIINRLNNINLDIKSFIKNAEVLQDKYTLEDELLICNAKKSFLLKELEDIGGVWSDDID
jgi:hypothetical protein